jgi:heat shock protein HslJ
VAGQLPSLADTSWIVVSYDGGAQGVLSALDGTTLTAAFAGGRVSGLAGCNNDVGTFSTTQSGISIGPIAATRRFCAAPPGAMEQEADYLAALARAATYELEGDALELSAADTSVAVSLGEDDRL